ncbi:MAG TPA: hypothetical protein VGB07_21870 [Blastocatellia bacterium]
MVEYVEQKTGKSVSTAISTAGTTGSVLWLSAAFLFTAFALPENIQMNPNVSANVSAKQNRHPEDACKSLKKMVGTAGFEPTASCTPSKRAELWDKNGTKLSLFLGLTLDHKLVAEAVNG